MDVQTNREGPRCRFDLVFEQVFSNDSIATWLLSKEPMTPDAITSDMMERMVALRSVVANGSSEHRVLHHPDEMESEAMEQEAAAVLKASTAASEVVKGEYFSVICHAQRDDCCYVSSTEDRIPFSFMEKPSPPAPGVRRGVCIQTQGGYAYIGYKWHLDGRSSLGIVFSDINSIISEKYFVLLERYPDTRYPKCSDILESLITVSMNRCVFCQVRRLEVCQCLPRMRFRYLPCIPAPDQRNAWSVLCWGVAKLETVSCQEMVRLENYAANARVVVPLMYHAQCVSENAATRTQGLQHYLWTIGAHRASWIYQDPPAMSAATRGIIQKQALLLEADECENEISFKGMEAETPDDPQSTTLSTQVRQKYEKYLGELEQAAWFTTNQACKFCPGKFFRRKHDLKRHVQSHHLARAEFQCALCGNKYKRKSYLQVHIASAHEKRTDVLCAVCGKGFANKSRLTRHLTEVHKIVSS